MQDKNLNARPERDAYEQVGELVRIFSRGPVWYANFQFEGKQRRQSLKTHSKKEARLRAMRLESELCNGGFEHSPEAPTVTQVIDDHLAFLEMESRAKSTLDRYRTVYEHLQLFAAEHKAIRISQVNLRFLDAYRQRRLADEKQPSTVHKEAVIIKQLVNFAVSRRRLAKNPLQGLKLKIPPKRSQPWWIWEEVRAILAAATEPHRAALTLLAETGMRIGELRHLTWDDVDLKKRVLLIQPKEYTNLKSGEKELWKPKTGKPRAVPLNDAAMKALNGLPQQGCWVFSERISPAYPYQDDRLSAERLRRYLTSILQSLGLKGHLHTFRHSFISNALTNGIPEAIVRQWVGHIDPEILRIYTHIADQASQNAMQRLAESNQHAESGKEPKNDAIKPAAKQAQIKHSRRKHR